MTDFHFVSELQNQAVRVLLEETFTHVHAEMHERYKAIGKKNAMLLGQIGYRFISKGEVYPPLLENEKLPNAKLPALHYSLLSELDAVNQLTALADFHYIKNFFVAAIGQSHNAIVLDAVLPMVLVNALKTRFAPVYFKIIDTGVYGALQQEPISVTRQNIENIKKHYQPVIAMLQRLLMDKMLLQM